MHGDPAALAETTKLQLPPDLLAELQKLGPKRPNDLSVEGWKPSLFTRIREALAGGKPRP
ncbi:MAG TPA: hypothetical protein VIL32_14060 [Steroidobacteraceae bacterium]